MLLSMLCDCLEFLIQNHDILTFIPPEATFLECVILMNKFFLERVILPAMKTLLSLGQGLETFPSLCDLLAMRHRAQLLSVSDEAHCFICHFHKVQRVHILCLSKFSKCLHSPVGNSLQVPFGSRPVVPLMQLSCWPQGQQDHKKREFWCYIFLLSTKS